MTRKFAATSTMAALISAGLSAVFAPTAASAQQDLKQLSACYVPGSGTMYRVKDVNTPAQCSAGHVEFQLTAAAKPGGGGPTGAAGGDLGGSYPNPSVVRIQGQPISLNAPSAGQVLTFSSGAWTPQAPAAASLPTNGAGAYNFSNINGLVSIGTINTGNVPASGAGTRLMWAPSRAAFRAGQVSGTQWDAASLGAWSIGLGNEVTASGNYGVSIGSETVASGYHSMALGLGGQASGNYSVAIGTFPTASGQGAVAMGTTTVASALEAFAFGSYTVANGINSTAMGKNVNTSGMTGTFVYGDASTNSVVGAPLDNSFIVRAQHFWFGTTSAPTAPSGHLIETSTGAYLSTGGTWTNTSDVNKKHAFKTIDSEDVLARIEAMPVSTWTYNTESDSVRHMGPTAQDFRKAFGLGDTDKAIATVDADGVSLAAVKALLRRTTDLRKENNTLMQRTTDLRKENDELRSALADVYRRLTELELVRR